MALILTLGALLGGCDPDPDDGAGGTAPTTSTTGSTCDAFERSAATRPSRYGAAISRSPTSTASRAARRPTWARTRAP